MAYLRELNYPVYEIEREHHYTDLGRQLESLKQMNYPVREGVEFSHQFNEIQRKVVSLRNLTGPFNPPYILIVSFLHSCCNSIQIMPTKIYSVQKYFKYYSNSV